MELKRGNQKGGRHRLIKREDNTFDAKSFRLRLGYGGCLVLCRSAILSTNDSISKCAKTGIVAHDRHAHPIKAFPSCSTSDVATPSARVGLPDGLRWAPDAV
jgi:hypothetical protein